MTSGFVSCPGQTRRRQINQALFHEDQRWIPAFCHSSQYGHSPAFSNTIHARVQAKYQITIFKRYTLNMSSIRFNMLFKLACASMLSGVSLGAKYGHVGQLDEDSTALFHKAQLYNTTNSLGLIACSLVGSASIPLKIAAGGFILGQACFIAPLYYQAVNGRDSVFRFIIPVGGTSMMTAWASLIFA